MGTKEREGVGSAREREKKGRHVKNSVGGCKIEWQVRKREKGCGWHAKT